MLGKNNSNKYVQIKHFSSFEFVAISDFTVSVSFQYEQAILKLTKSIGDAQRTRIHNTYTIWLCSILTWHLVQMLININIKRRQKIQKNRKYNYVFTEKETTKFVFSEYMKIGDKYLIIKKI